MREYGLRCHAVAFLLAAMLGALLNAGAARAECVGDIDGDGTVGIDELVRSVHAALSGCSDGEKGPGRISFSTDRVRYSQGNELRATLTLYSGPETMWWSWRPLHPTFDPCIFSLKISRGHTFREEIVYDSTQEREQIACGAFDGGPGKVHGVKNLPPAYTLEKHIRLAGNVGDAAGNDLGPGVYLVEATLRLGLVPAGTDPYDGVDSPFMRAGVQIEIGD